VKRTPLAQQGTSDTTLIKDDIQHWAREIVILRDGDCILKKYRHCDDPVKQADHLITRANSATYADTRLIVCLCRSCHGWKHWHKEEYDALVKTILPPDRVKLWEECEGARWKPTRTTLYDWKLALAALKQEYRELAELSTCERALIARGAFSLIPKPFTAEDAGAALGQVKRFATQPRRRLLVIEDNPAEQLGVM
jgi:hypothetical protein